MVKENQKYNFAENLSRVIGYPYWNSSVVYSNDTPQNIDLVVTPVGKPTEQETKAILISKVFEDHDRVIHEFVTRLELSDILQEVSAPETRSNIFFELLHMSLFDDTVFNEDSKEIENFMCTKTKNGNPIKSSRPSGEDVECECIVYEIVNGINNGEYEEESGTTNGESGGNDPVTGGGGDNVGGEGGITEGGDGGSGLEGGSGIPGGIGGGGFGANNDNWEVSQALKLLMAKWNAYIDWCNSRPITSVSNIDTRNGEEGGLDITYYLVDCEEEGVNGPDLQVENPSSAEDAVNMANTLGVDCDQMNCLFDNPDLFEEVMSLAENANFACNDKSKEEILSEAIETVCDCDNPEECEDNLSEFYRALEGEDWINIPRNFEEECPCFYDILNQLNQTNSGNWLCDVINGIDQSEESTFVQNFEIYDGDRIFNSPDYNRGEATLHIPRSYCEGNSGLTGLEISAVFIHEMLHSHMFTLLFEEFPNGVPEDFFFWEINDEGGQDGVYNQQYWVDLVRSYNGIEDNSEVSGNHHYLFFNYLQDFLMNALYDLNGGFGDPGDYLYYVHLILNTQNLSDAINGNILDPNGDPIIPEWSSSLTDDQLNFMNTFNLTDYENIWNQEIEGNFNIGC